MSKYLMILSAAMLTAIASTANASDLMYGKPSVLLEYKNLALLNHPYANIIANAELNASPNAQKVLVSARQMVENKEIIKGGCWDYLNAAWNKAGFDNKKRQTLFQTDIDKPPYANIDSIQAGDWLYHINYGYNNIEHSGLFVGWIDKQQGIGLTLSYAGEKRGEPARYKAYDLTGVYRIIRTEN